MPTTPYESGDVVLIPFPFTDLTTIKYRPALVVSSGRFNRAQEDIIAVAITSAFARKNKAGHYEYALEERERQEAHLLYPSLVKLAKIVTIDKRLVRKHLGALSSRTTKIIIKRVRDILRVG